MAERESRLPQINENQLKKLRQLTVISLASQKKVTLHVIYVESHSFLLRSAELIQVLLQRLASHNQLWYYSFRYWNIQY